VRRRATQNKTPSNAVDQMIVRSSYVVGVAENEFPAQDLLRPMPSWLLTQSPSKNFLNQITWVQAKKQIVTSISNSVPTESNLTFHLSDLPDILGLAGFFDQYCIYAVTVSIHPSFEGAGSTLYTFGTVVTAIDYDNAGTLGSIDAVESYGSAVTHELSPGQGIQRFIKPCVAPALYTSSASFSGYGVQRLWVDSSVTSVPHYGFRSFFVSNTVSGLSCTFDLNYVIGFRNNF